MSLFKSSILALAIVVAISGVWLLRPGTHDSSLAQLERLSGANFCADGGVKDGDQVLGLSSTISRSSSENSFTIAPDPDAYRARVVSRFDTAESNCLDMDFVSSSFGLGPFRQSNVSRNSGTIEIDGRRVPLIISRIEADRATDQPVDSIQTIYVRVGGGPGAVNITAQSDEFIEYLEGDYLIDFYYTGHGFNIVHPSPSFEIAFTQLAKFLEQVRARNPESKIVLLGQSLGAVLSLEAIRNSEISDRSSAPAADKLVLLSPPFGSLDRTAELLEELRVARGVEGTKWQYRVREPSQNYNDYGRLESHEQMDVFRSFYQQQNEKADLLERVKNVSSSLPILVIYGDADVRIYLEKAKAFAAQKIGNVRVSRLEGMDHQPGTLDQIRSIREQLRDFVDE